MHNTFKVNTIIYYHLFFSFLYKVAKNLKSTNENFTSTINKKKSGKPSWLGLKIDITEVGAPFLIHLWVQNRTNQRSSILGNPKIPNCTFICTLQRLGRSHLQTVLLHHKSTDTTPQQQNTNTQQKTSKQNESLNLDIKDVGVAGSLGYGYVKHTILNLCLNILKLHIIRQSNPTAIPTITLSRPFLLFLLLFLL